jgi:hypothetical protein
MVLSACGGTGDREGTVSGDEHFIQLKLDRHGSDELVGYYMSGLLAPEDEGPFASRLVVKESGDYFVDVDRLARADSQSAASLEALAGNSRSVDWTAFQEFVSDTYFRVRDIPATRQDLYTQEGFVPGDPGWMSLETVGVMSTRRRRVFVKMDAVLHALRSYRENEDRIMYPEGTVFIGEHMDGEAVSETTVMWKSNSQWDFFAYDEQGRLADSTKALPRSRRVPTQCFGCHFGNKLYEPERSFPALAPDGPHGPRAVYVDESLRDPDVVRYFDEHRQRADGVLGLYVTILVSELRSRRTAGALDASTAELLTSLGL